MTFKKGQSGNPAGRPKGCLDKYTRIKHMIIDILESREDEIKTMNLKNILTFVAATSPKQTKIEIDKPIKISWEE